MNKTVREKIQDRLHMDIQKYHNARLEFLLPAVHEGYAPGDPIFVARGVALMTVSGSDVLLHHLEGSRFQPVSALPFLQMIFRRSSSVEGSENTIFLSLAIMNAKHIFDDPDSITELKAEHADAIRTSTHGHSDYVAKKDAEHREAITKLDAEIAALKLKLSEEHERLIEAWKKIPSANSRTIGQVMMAPGSATTQSRSR